MTYRPFFPDISFAREVLEAVSAIQGVGAFGWIVGIAITFIMLIRLAKVMVKTVMR